MTDQPQTGRSGAETDLFRLLAENVLDYAVFVIDAERRVRTWSHGAERLFGYAEVEILGQSSDLFFTREDREAGQPLREVEQALAEGRGEDDRWHVKKDGSRFWSAGVLTPLRDEAGRLHGFAKIMRDQTALKLADESRRQAQDRLARDAMLLANVRDAVIVTDLDGIVTYWNEGATRLFGWTAEETVGRPYADRYPEPVRSWIADQIRLRGEGVDWEGEFEDYRKDGSKVWIDSRVRLMRDDAGRPVGLLGISHDITARKRAEAVRRASEERLRTLADNLPDGAIYQVVQDADGANRFTFLSGGVERLFGVKPEEALADPVALYGTIAEEDRERVLAAEAQSLRTLRRFDCEFRHTMPDGEVRWVHARSAPRRVPDGGVVWEGALTDATDRKRAEAALRESEARLRRVVETNAVGLIVADFSGRLIEANDAFLGTVGHTRDDLRSGRLNFLALTPPEYRPLDEAAMAEMLRTGWHEPFEKEYVRKDGSRVPVLVGTAYLGKGSDGNDQGVGFIVDLSRQKAAERALRESEQRFRGLMDQAPFSVQIFSADGRTLRTNRAWEELWGVTTEQIDGYNILEDAQLEAKGILPLLKGAFAGEPVDLPEIAYDPNETIPDLTRNEEPVRWVSAVAYPIKDAAGRVREVALVHADVTARRRAEAAVRESEEWLRLALEAGRMGTWEWDVRTGRIRWSEGLETIHGLAPGSFDGTFETFQTLIHPEDQPGLRRAIEESLRNGTPYEADFRFVRPDGTVGWMAGRGKPYFGDSGEPLRMVGVGLDVTARKQAEEDLARVTAEGERRRRLYETILSNTPDLAYVFGLDHRFTYANDILLRMWGKTWDEAIGKNCLELGYEPWHAEMHDREIEQVVATKKPIRGEVPFEGTFGRRIYDYIFVPVIGEGGEVEAVAGTTRDVTERKEAEERIERSERQTRGILESITDAFYAVGRDWRFSYLNHEAERLLGRTRDDLVGKHIWEEFAPAVETAFYDAYQRAMEGTETVRFEVFYPPHEKWYEVHAYPSSDGIAVYFRDITERRETEAALRESEERFRAIAQKSVTGIAEVDLTGRFVFVNGRQCEILGRSREELLALRMQDVTHPDDLPANLSLFQRLVQDGTPFLIEKRYVRPDGAAVWVSNSVSAVRDAEGRLKKVVAVSVDVAERKRAEESIRRLIGQFRTLAAASATINSSLSKESVLQVVTEEARFVVGTHQAVSSLSDNERWAQAINTVSLSEKFADHRTYSQEPDGSGIYTLVCKTNKPMRLTQEELVSHPAWRNFGGDNGHPPMRGWLAAPLVGRDGRNLGLIQLSDKQDGGDFTEEDEAILVQLAQTASVALENARLYDELRDADRRKDEFLAMLAHELRNPLAPIRSGLDLLKMSQAEPDVVEVMSDQVGHVVRLVDDLLDVSRILRGKVELKREPTDLSAVLRRAVETVRPRTDEHRQRLTVSIPAEPIRLDADPVRLTQVAANLLNNASKYTDDGGEVRLEASAEGGEAVIRVSDTGIGIEPKLLPRVFDLFTQADQALDRSQGGLGIGLTVVKSLVEMHGGNVSASSEGVGRGATFTVRLPVNVPAEGGGEDVPEVAPARSCRILLVDDNAPAAKLLGRLLEKLGDHRILAAHDGPSALAKAEEFRPDLVLLDIGLPRMDGYEVARRLRAMPEFRNTLLVALTGYGTEEDRRRSIEAGFDDHLVKPPGVDLLRRVLAHPMLKRP